MQLAYLSPDFIETTTFDKGIYTQTVLILKRLRHRKLSYRPHVVLGIIMYYDCVPK